MIPDGGSLNFGTVSYGVINKEPEGDYPLRVYNTGNADITQVKITPYDVPGVVRSNEKILASWFRIGALSDPCQTGSVLNDGFSQITGISINKGLGNSDDIYFCLNEVQVSAGNQDYSTSGGNSWVFDVVFALAVLRVSSRKKKRLETKKNKGSKNKLRDLMGEMFLEIFEDKLKNKYGSDIENIFNEFKSGEENVVVPISIFKEKDGAAEILTKYLRENLLLKFSEIAKLIKRDQRTVGINYKNAVKNKRKIKLKKSSATIPIEIFSNRKMSILESIIFYLREKEFKNSEIAIMLERDPRNISTLYSRVMKKI
jgi:hypothetical protein